MHRDISCKHVVTHVLGINLACRRYVMQNIYIPKTWCICARSVCAYYVFGDVCVTLRRPISSARNACMRL